MFKLRNAERIPAGLREEKQLSLDPAGAREPPKAENPPRMRTNAAGVTSAGRLEAEAAAAAHL